MTEAEVVPSFVQVSLPVPTAEEILDDLRNAPESDVVFSAPPAEPANGTVYRGGPCAHTQTKAVYILQLFLFCLFFFFSEEQP